MATKTRKSVSTRSPRCAGPREDVLLRLRKLEGQVRGIQQMVVDDRHCLDLLQQLNAVASAVREVAMVALETHLAGCFAAAVASGDAEGAVKDVMAVVRRAAQSR